MGAEPPRTTHTLHRQAFCIMNPMTVRKKQDFNYNSVLDPALLLMRASLPPNTYNLYTSAPYPPDSASLNLLSCLAPTPTCIRP